MSLEKRDGSPNWQYVFCVGGKRHRGTTGTTNKIEAARIEGKEKLKAKAERAGIVKKEKVAAAAPSMSLDLACDRYFEEEGKHLANADAIERDLAMCVKFFAEQKPPILYLTDVNNDAMSKLITWRRSHHRWNKPTQPLISNASVNRSTTSALQPVFTRALDQWDMEIPKPPKWSKHKLEEAEDRTRELRKKEDAAIAEEFSEDYERLRRFSIASGVRKRNTIIKWTQVDFDEMQIKFVGKRKKTRLLPITTDMLAILKECIGHHPVFVFTYKAERNKPKHKIGGKICPIIAGQRYPITYWGLTSHHRRRFKKAGVVDYRWHDNRHTFAGTLLRGSKNIKLVKDALWHEQISTTEKYAHLETSDIRDGMEDAERRKSALTR